MIYLSLLIARYPLSCSQTTKNKASCKKDKAYRVPRRARTPVRNQGARRYNAVFRRRFFVLKQSKLQAVQEKRVFADGSVRLYMSKAKRKLDEEMRRRFFVFQLKLGGFSSILTTTSLLLACMQAS